MKFCILFIFCFVYSFANINSVPDIEEKAKDAYNNLSYQKSLNYYQEIFDLGIRNSTIYYNLGNNYYKLNDFYNALLNYERALLYNPNNIDILTNIGLAIGQFSYLNNAELNLFQKVVNFFTIFTLIKLLIFFFILNIVFLFFIFGINKKKLFLQPYKFFLIMLALFLFIYYPRIKYIFIQDKALINKEIVEIKSGPADNLSTLFTLQKGEKVTVQKKDSDWAYVYSLKGDSGWINNHHLTIIEY
jgi:uncharacterized protein YgiM (DUF1202 family)